MGLPPSAFRSIPARALLRQLGATDQGLTAGHARRRLERSGANRLGPRKRTARLRLCLPQCKRPIGLIRRCAAILSSFLDDPAAALIILASAALGFRQEYGATTAVEKLLAIVQIQATPRCAGRPREIPGESIGPGDGALARAGDGSPGDGLPRGARDRFAAGAA